MTTLLYTDPHFVEHDTRGGHPERPERMGAVDRGIASTPARDALELRAPRLATIDELALVHERPYLESLERFCAAGGGRLDPDTVAGAASWRVARLAAGAGLAAIEELDEGKADNAFLAVRPPGHHATPTRAMGFCLLNNVAVTAAALAERGDRVLVVDIDAHHGNGTQDAFWDDPRVTYVSIHQYPMYPGTGALRERGGPQSLGGTVNVPVPERTAGDMYRRIVDDVIVPIADRDRPDWVLLSTGFDAHRADPLTDLGLSAGDYYDLTARILALVPAGRRVVFLEGGYNLDAVAASTDATLAALAEVNHHHPEPITTYGPDAGVVDAVVALHDLA